MRQHIFSTLLLLAACMGMSAQVGDRFFITPDTSGYEKIPSTLEGWARRLNTFGHFVPQEKVYVHMDNTCYFLGDTLWYAVYTRRTDRDVPSRISRVLYVELLNQDGYLMERQILEMKNGKGWGCFALPDTLYAGYYELRAYTRWQLNWGQYEHEHTRSEEDRFYTMAMAKEFFRDYDKLYSRVFPVYDKPEEPGVYRHDMTLRPLRRYFKDEVPRPKFQITLYPEGGTLVGDAPCRMAFEVSNEEGETATGRCVILDAQKQQVAEARTVNRGRGLLYFTPKPNEKYEAVFYSDSLNRKKDTIQIKTKVRDIPTEGIALMLNLRKEALEMEVNARGSLAEKEFGYTIMHEGIVEEFGQLQGRRSAVTIPRSALRPGVNQMTLFDADGRIYADRLFFVSAPGLTRPTLTITGMKEQYEPYEKIQLMVATADDLAASPSISLAVRDATFSDPLYDNASIQVEMLLSSEIRGFVPDPGWYFERDDEEHRAALDLLMLTQGWRRFDWREMATPGDFMLTHPAEYSQVLEGSVHKYRGYDKEDYFEMEQTARQMADMGMTRDEVNEHLRMEYGNNADLRFLQGSKWQTRWDKAASRRYDRPFDPWRVNALRAPIPISPNDQGDYNYSYNRRDFSSQQVYQGGVVTQQDRMRNNRTSWQRLINNASKWKNEPHVHIEFHKPGCTPLGGDTVTTRGTFRIAVPDIDGYCWMFVGAVNPKKLKNNKKYNWTQVQPDHEYYNANRYPEYYVRLSFPYPRFVKPYSWYQCHLAPLPESLAQRQRKAGFADDEMLSEVVVRSRHGGLRHFDATKPAFVIDAYDAFNATIDAGFNYGRFEADFMFNVAHTYISDMNMQRHYDINVRRDGKNLTHNMSYYQIRQYHQLSNLEKVVIYTDYSPRLEGSKRYQQADQPSVTVNLIKLPDNTKRLHFLNRRYVLQGFNYPEQYYHVDYSKRRPTADEAGDYRRTLYWNPDLKLEKDGQTQVTLYNNSRQTTIEASVAGQTEDGTLLY